MIVDDAAAYAEFLTLSPDAVAAAITSKTTSPSAPTSGTNAGQPAAATIKASEPLPTPSGSPKRLSPAARHLAESKGVDISRVTATAFKGEIISKADVLNAIKAGNVNVVSKASHSAAPSSSLSPSKSTPVVAPKAAPTPISYHLDLSAPVNPRFKDIPNNNMRKVIAKRLTESKATVPHLYVTAEMEIDELLSMRKGLKKELDINVSVNDVVIRAAALALRDLPAVNSKWNKTTQTVEESSSVDISVAVATPNGLITPIVKNAERRGLVNISQVLLLSFILNVILSVGSYRR